MKNQKSTECILFQDIFRRPIQAIFDQDNGTSDGGAILIRAADEKIKLTEELAATFRSQRVEGKVMHSFLSLLRQRIYGIVCGYHDGNDAARIGNDPLLRILAGDDRNNSSLASQPTISRFENSCSTRDLFRMAEALADRVIEHNASRLSGKARHITIDLDPTVDPTHGEQQLTFFNAFYDSHCYLPMTGFLQFNDESEQYLFAAILRPGNSPDRKGAIGILKRTIPKLLSSFPDAEIRVRLDGGFACEEILHFLEQWKCVKYAINLPKHKKIEKRIRGDLKKVRRKFKRTGRAARIYSEFRHANSKWSRSRRIIAKAEIVTYPGREPRDNPRFLVTNMQGTPRKVYEKFYCRRGDTENRIKELKYSLALDRTSCSRFLANQFRVLLSAAAFVLLQQIRYCASKTIYARAQASRIIDQLIKLGGRVTVSVRRIVIHLPKTAPSRSDWSKVAKALGAA